MDIKEINFEIANLLKKELTEASFKTWCKESIENAYMEGNNIIIPVANDFEKAIIEEKYLLLFNTAYCRFIGNGFSYNKIIIRVDKNIESKQDQKEEYVLKTVEDMRKIADRKNAESINIKKEIEKTLRKILDTIEMMAENYSTSYMCNKVESDIIENVSEELVKLGFKTSITDFSNHIKVISIKWDK